MDAKQGMFLLQVCDSGFPNGSFAHSFGLEALIDSGVVRDGETFQAALYDYYRLQLIPFEGLAAHLAHGLAMAGDVDGICALAHRVHISTLPRATRQGMVSIGQRTVAELARLTKAPLVETYAARVQSGDATATFGVSVAVAGACLGIARDETVACVLYAAMAGLVGAAVRTIPLGQSVGQRLLVDARTWIGTLPDYGDRTVSDLSASCPIWEIAQMHHEHLDGRLFMS